MYRPGRQCSLDLLEVMLIEPAGDILAYLRPLDISGPGVEPLIHARVYGVIDHVNESLVGSCYVWLPLRNLDEFEIHLAVAKDVCGSVHERSGRTVVSGSMLGIWRRPHHRRPCRVTNRQFPSLSPS